MSPVRITEDNIFTFLTTGNWILLAILAVAGFLLGSPRFAGSIIIGGILAIGNFFWQFSALKRVLLLPAAQAGRFALSRYLARLAVLAVVIWALIRFAHINVVGLLIGLSITVLNIIILAFYKVARKGG